MRALAVMFGTVFALAACGERADAPAPTPEEAAVGADMMSSEHIIPLVPTLSATGLRGVCKAGLAAIHGQDLSAIEIDGLEGQVVNASWRAPVDGGRRRAQCRVEGDIVVWKQVGAANPEQNRWMNQSGDPVTRYMLHGDDTIMIITKLPDGSTSTETYSVAAEQEAR